MTSPLTGNETAAIAVTTSAPAWYQWLQQINTILAFISLIIGIIFTIWTWHRSISKGKYDGVNRRDKRNLIFFQHSEDEDEDEDDGRSS